MPPITLPLARFPLLDEAPADTLRGEVERNLPRVRGLPWMIMGGDGRDRLAVVRDDLDPAACARVERALAGLPEVEWTALCGEAVLERSGGALRHAFVRMAGARGWEAWTRPFVALGEGVEWLADWDHSAGSGPAPAELAVLFPAADPGGVRFVPAVGQVEGPDDAQPLPDGATADDVTRLAGLWLESYFFAHGFAPPAVVRVASGQLEVRLLPRNGPAHAANDLAVRLAQDPDTEAVGVYSRSRDDRVQPPAEQIRVRMEFREGPALVWRRRFRVVAPNSARWLDPAGEVVERERLRLWFSRR